jgi:hypothetical protein
MNTRVAAGTLGTVGVTSAGALPCRVTGSSFAAEVERVVVLGDVGYFWKSALFSGSPSA